MILWGIVCGAVIGWSVDDFNSFGLIAGAALGIIAGLWLRSTLRRELLAVSETMRGDIGVALGSRPVVAEPAAVVSAAPAAAVAVTPDTDAQPWAASPLPESTRPEEPARPNFIELGIGAAQAGCSAATPTSGSV